MVESAILNFNFQNKMDKAEGLYSPKFYKTVREVASELPDDTELTQLRIASSSRQRRPGFQNVRENYATHPPREWKKLYEEGLDRDQKTALMRMIGEASKVCDTVGDLRGATLEKLLTRRPDVKARIGEGIAEALKEIFGNG